jgi:hypothetical protein
MHWCVPLLLDYTPPIGISIEESARIAMKIQQVQNQTVLYLQTGLGGDVADDMLNELGINPHEYWAALEQSIDDLIREDVFITGLERYDVSGTNLRPKHLDELAVSLPGY